VSQVRKCIDELADTALPKEELASVVEVLQHFSKEYLNYHELRTRKSGTMRYVDLHLTICSEFRVGEAHKVCDRIEDEIARRFKEVDVNIHVEPCGNHGPACEQVCEFSKVHRQQAKEH
jgi:divalent metal cation (Fe/Co/Zn/Cd) transporter